MLAQPEFTVAGFHHFRSYFDPHALTALEAQITLLYAMQANKIAQYRDLWRLTDILEAMEEADKAALYEVQRYLAASPMVRGFLDPELTTLCASLLGVSPHLVLIEGPGLLISRPESTRLAYKWHSEVHYYPKRRKFVNLWFPLFGDRTEQNGAMHVKPGSHKEHWGDFAEYDAGPHTFQQYEIPDGHVASYQSHICETKRGDLIVFDRNLVHRSAVNYSKDYAFAIVARIWYPGDDLTLSGVMAVTPYGGDIGRSGLMVER
jgi:hypothetical protein